MALAVISGDVLHEQTRIAESPLTDNTFLIAHGAGHYETLEGQFKYDSE